MQLISSGSTPELSQSGGVSGGWCWDAREVDYNHYNGLPLRQGRGEASSPGSLRSLERGDWRLACWVEAHQHDSPPLSLPWEFWMRNLDKSLSAFWCGPRKTGQVEGGRENLSILYLQFGSSGTGGFCRKYQFSLAVLLASFLFQEAAFLSQGLCICCCPDRSLERLPLQLKSLFP